MIRKIFVLGSGGGRMVTMKQERKTGGLAFLYNDEIFIIDPGPGSIYNFKELHLNPFSVTGILISHRHPDHYSDAETYIEAATRGGNIKRGFVLGAKSVLETVKESEYPAISTYHKNLPEIVLPLAPNERYQYKNIIIKALQTLHNDPYTIGFKFNDEKHSITYYPETEFEANILKDVESTDVLILSVLRPGNRKIHGHLCVDDVIKMVNILSPKRVIITHFGSMMIRAPPENEARKITEKTGIKTLAAQDGMIITISKFLK